eukprot:scaffold19122_cov162-Skeletonema_marinoi.AAC.10
MPNAHPSTLGLICASVTTASFVLCPITPPPALASVHLLELFFLPNLRTLRDRATKFFGYYDYYFLLTSHELPYKNVTSHFSLSFSTYEGTLWRWYLLERNYE